MAEHESRLSAMAAAIREVDAPQRIRGDYAAFLRAHGVAETDVETLVARGGERMLVYRALVHNRLRNVVREFIGRSAARRGRAEFRADFDAFMAERAAKTFYLRDVPAEFVAWVSPRWTTDADAPRYLVDLARHELLETDVRNDPAGGEPATELPLALDRPLRFDGSCRLMRYGWAVHKLSYAIDDTTIPPEQPTILLVFRDRSGKVRYLEIGEWSAHVLEALMIDGLAVADGLRRAAERAGGALDDERLAKAANLFAELADHGVLLGAEP